MPFELKGYLALTILSLLTLSRRGRVLLGLTFLACLALLAQAVWTTHALPPAFGPMDGRLLICCFLMGVSLYRLRERVKFSAALGLAGLAASLILLALPAGDYLATLPVAYATVWLGLQNPSKLGLLRKGDYSYGVFLFGFPIQQAFVSLGPWTRQWWVNLAVCAPLALLIGAISWHAVEKPALGLRPWLLMLEDNVLALLRRTRALRPAVQACDAVIGANLARARTAARLSPLRLARQMNISVFDLVRTEAGWRMLAPVELCYACRALNLTVADLFHGFDQVEPA